jgi:hypothetical protein
MLKFPSRTQRSPAEHKLAQISLTEDEQRHLRRVQAIAAAERHLVPLDRPCSDHQACRRLAFVRWLCATGRLSECAEP